MDSHNRFVWEPGDVTISRFPDLILTDNDRVEWAEVLTSARNAIRNDPHYGDCRNEFDPGQGVRQVENLDRLIRRLLG